MSLVIAKYDLWTSEEINENGLLICTCAYWKYLIDLYFVSRSVERSMFCFVFSFRTLHLSHLIQVHILCEMCRHDEHITHFELVRPNSNSNSNCCLFSRNLKETFTLAFDLRLICCLLRQLIKLMSI